MKRETVLPKNIRQIGEIQQDKKVYLEDYVMTFLHKKEKEEQEKGCTGVLLGKKEEDEKGRYAFVRGALMLDQKEEGEKRWEKVQEEQKKFFPGEELIGCFVMGLLEEERIQEMMNLFPGPPFLIFHLQEGEENVYWSQEKQYQRVGGYFIFYERNPQMQKYMAENCEPRKVEQEEGNSDRAIVNFRQKVKEKGEAGKRGGMRYLASSFLVLTILLLGVTIINNYDRMKEIEAVVAHLTAQQNAQRLKQAAEDGTAQSGIEQNGVSQSGMNQNEITQNEIAQDEIVQTGGTAQNEAGLDGMGQNVIGQDGTAQDGMSQDETGQTGTVQSGEAQTGAAQDGMSQDKAGQTGTAQSGVTQTGTALAGMEQNVTGQDGAAQDGMSQDEAGQTGTVQSGETQTGAALAGMEQNVTGQDGAGQDEAGQTGTAQSGEAPEDQAGAEAEGTAGTAEASAGSGENGVEVSAEAAETVGDGAEASAESSLSDSIAAQSLKERNYSAESPSGKTDEILEAASRQNRSVYTIRYGDTLADISEKYYGTLEKVEEICSLNGIDDANKIVPGEKIVLP